MDNKKIISELKSYLQEHYRETVKEVILFGSQTNEKTTVNSDFDVLIILEGDYNVEDEDRLLELCYDIDLKYDIVIDAHIISDNELNSIRGQQPLFINAIKDGQYA